MASEKEIFFYADITKPEGLTQATRVIVQDQYSYDIKDEEGNSSGIIRVRAESEAGNQTYEQTIKYEIGEKTAGVTKKEEQNIPIEKGFYDAWIKCFDAPGCHKLRHIFKSTQIKLNYLSDAPKDEEVKEEDLKEIILDFELDIEVDVFINKDGQKAVTCKIDIELDGLLEHLKQNHPEIKAFDISVALSNLPLGLENIFNGRSDDPEHKAKSKALWTEFTYKDSERPQ